MDGCVALQVVGAKVFQMVLLMVHGEEEAKYLIYHLRESSICPTLFLFYVLLPQLHSHQGCFVHYVNNCKLSPNSFITCCMQADYSLFFPLKAYFFDIRCSLGCQRKRSSFHRLRPPQGMSSHWFLPALALPSLFPSSLENWCICLVLMWKSLIAMPFFACSEHLF